MKKIIFTFALFCFAFASLFSQEFAGKRIYSGNLSLNLTGSTVSSQVNQTNLTLNSTFLTGKIRENNTYTAVGFNFGITSSQNPQQSGFGVNNYSNSSYNIGPAIQFGKFVKVFDKFYFAPNTTLGASYIGGSSETPTSKRSLSGFSGRLNVSPLNFVYQVQNNFLLSMNLGNFGINYSYIGSKRDNTNTFGTITNTNNDTSIYDLSVFGSLTNFSGIGAYYLF
jgi:hypothetical protein